MDNGDVTLSDVYWTAHLYRTSPRGLNGRIRRVRRNGTIVGCYEVGNVTVDQLAAAAHLHESTIYAILRDARTPTEPRPPKLQIVH
jgi:hypothetical protein